MSLAGSVTGIRLQVSAYRTEKGPGKQSMGDLERTTFCGVVVRSMTANGQGLSRYVSLPELPGRDMNRKEQRNRTPAPSQLRYAVNLPTQPLRDTKSD